MDECRFCKEGPEAGTLISPCACKGSIALVHAHCLQAWFNHKRASPDALGAPPTTSPSAAVFQ